MNHRLDRILYLNKLTGYWRVIEIINGNRVNFCVEPIEITRNNLWQLEASLSAYSVDM